MLKQPHKGRTTIPSCPSQPHVEFEYKDRWPKKLCVSNLLNLSILHEKKGKESINQNDI